jgi:hypothetical protein
VSNLSKGYVIIPPFKLDSPLILETFHSDVKDFNISYPNGWKARDLPQGNHGDKEVIASIRAPRYDYPYITIAYRTVSEPLLEKVAVWGKSRIKAEAYAFSEFDEISINGKPALLRGYSYTSDFLPIIGSPQRVDCQHIYLLDDNDAYTIKMCINEKNSSEQLKSTFEVMIQSISFD